MRRQRGFTLMEMMIAMAILAGALTWIVLGMSRNIRAENRAKLTATATFLARERMAEFEDELYEKGFGEFENEITGDFDDKGFSRFSWRVLVEKVELPSVDQIQTMMGNAQDASKSGTSGEKKPETTPGGLAGAALSGQPGSPLTSGAGALASQFQIIKEVLEQGIRRVTVKIEWKEGKAVHSVDVVAYYTDVRKVDQAIQLPTTGKP